MRIERIIIENFKAFKELKFECNSEYNLIVGENNIGKTTVLEAIQLWIFAYEKLIQKNGKNFYGQNTPCYLGFESVNFLRIISDRDIFNNARKKLLSITLVFKQRNHEEEFPLKISLEKTTIPNSYYRIKYEFEPFNNFKDKVIGLGLNLRNAVLIYQTKPIFHLTKNEPFYNNAQLLKKISLGKSHEVLRNKIIKAENSETKLSSLENRLNSVFSSEFKLRSNIHRKQDDEHVKVWIKEGENKEVEISMIGSGILQVLEIFSTIEFIKRKDHSVNVLLIDEPDSHIHSNLQNKLLDELRSNLDNQSFLVSHNDRLIDKANDGELFYFNSKLIEEGVVSCLPKACYVNVKTDLANELFSLEKENSEKIILITEGKSDKKILETAWDKLHPGVDMPYLIIPAGREIDVDKRTGSADSVQQTLEFVSNLIDTLKIVGLFDNDQEGNNKFKGLKKGVFENHSLNIKHRKHLEKDIYGLLLPVPEDRVAFVSDEEMNDRYLVIEHFFSKEILENNDMIKNHVMNTEVFRVRDKKKAFSEATEMLSADDFKNFTLIFDSINALFN